MTTEIPNDDITYRLECRYPIGPMMENGEPEFGWRDFGGPLPSAVLPLPICKEAAAEIRRLRELFRVQQRVHADHIGQLKRRHQEVLDLAVKGVAELVPQYDRKVADLNKRIKALESANRNLTERNALLRQRHDMPADRIPAYQRLVDLQETLDQLRAEFDDLGKLMVRVCGGPNPDAETKMVDCVERIQKRLA